MATNAYNASGGCCAIGVDLGGQAAKLAVVDCAGRVYLHRQVPVEASAPSGHIVSLLIGHIEALSAEASATGLAPGAIGVVMPGYMDRERTRLLFAANLPTLSGSSFLVDLKTRLPLPVAFDADCNAAALAEYGFGAGRGVSQLIVATVGTGIGAGVIIDGQVVRLRGHVAGSLGHVVVDARGPTCGCGGRGCVEALASGRALERQAATLADAEPASRLAALRKQRGRLTGVEIGLALQENDPAAHRAVAECGRWLGVAVASWAAIYDPDKVLIGGGVAALGEPFLAAIRAGFREVGQPAAVQRVLIEPAALGPDAGVIGAATMMLPR